MFSAGKEGSIIKWDLSTGKELSMFRKLRAEGDVVPKAKAKRKGKEKAWWSAADLKGHADEVLALALSDDGKFLASGGKDRKVVIWDAEKGEWLKNFGGHKDSISVREPSSRLASCT